MKIMKSDRMEALARKELNQKEFYDMYTTLETNRGFGVLGRSCLAVDLDVVR